jgi:hypothetical protein
MMTQNITLYISVDTEEDNWQPARTAISIENIRELPRLEGFLDRLGARATYLTTFEVAARPWASAILKDIHGAGRSEIGAHLHPWNTPPTDAPEFASVTMTKNLPYSLQLAKIQRLTSELERALGEAPVSFRAGRYGLGRETVRALICSGYEVDCSITPMIDHRRADNGPDFRNAPLHCYTLDGDGDVKRPEANGRLVEVPLSLGFRSGPFELWRHLEAFLAAPVLGPTRALGIAGRLPLPRKIFLSPEFSSTSDMVALSSRLIAQGLRHLQLSFHSPSLRPGLTPYVTTKTDLDHFYGSIEDYLDSLTRIAQVRFATLRDAKHLVANSPREAP